MMDTAPPTPMDPAIIEQGRLTRYSTLLPIPQFTTTPVAIIGVGAVGSQIARILVAMGVQRFVICDPDKVEAENLGAQGFTPRDIGDDKTSIIADRIWAHNSSSRCVHRSCPIQVAPQDPDLLRALRICPAVFSCVDSMEARRYIYSQLGDTSPSGLFPLARHFYDARLAAEEGTIYALESKEFPLYERTLFDDSEALQIPCTERMTLYTALIAASLMVHAYTRHLRADPVPPVQLFSLPNGFLIPQPFPPEVPEALPSEGANDAPPNEVPASSPERQPPAPPVA